MVHLVKHQAGNKKMRKQQQKLGVATFRIDEEIWENFKSLIMQNRERPASALIRGWIDSYVENYSAVNKKRGCR